MFFPANAGFSLGVRTLKLMNIPGTDRVAVKHPSEEWMEQVRKKAKDLLDLWARKSSYIQLTFRPTDIRIAGKLISLEGGDYLFRFSSGINTRILLLTYDDISIESGYLDILSVFLRNADGHELTLSLLGKREPTAEEFDAVYQQLREWVRSEALLTVRFGDELRSTLMSCTVSESNSGIFSFRGVNLDLTHSLDPAQAGSFRIERCLKWAQITSYTQHTNHFFSVADGDLMENLAAKGRYSDGINALQWCAETMLFK
jgi:hypothetical protein